MVGAIIRTNSIDLPVKEDLIRIPPRKPEDRQEGYLARFDFHGIFSDVFFCDDSVIAVGPPYLNLLDSLSNARYFLDEVELSDPSAISFNELNRTSRTKIQLPCVGGSMVRPERLRVEFPSFAVECGVGADQAAAFCDKNVLMTMSRDNPLLNISDWVRMNVVNNEIDAVLVYDNRSKDYSKKQLLEEIMSVEGVSVAVVVDWPHPYGVAADSKQIWDSDFGQYSAWEDARWRFLRKANSVMVGDCDEIPLAEDGVPCWKLAAETKSGVLYYRLRDVEPVRMCDAEGAGLRRHSDYNYYLEGRLASNKYTYIPSRLREDQQLLVHAVTGAPDELPGKAYGRHFKALHRRWRDGSFGYTYSERAKDESLSVDDVLSRAFRKASLVPNER